MLHLAVLKIIIFKILKTNKLIIQKIININ